MVLAALLALILAVALSHAAALAALLGASIIIANLYLLAILGRFLLMIGQQGGPSALGAALAPLKMMLIIGGVYVIISSGRINLAGFTLGMLTQLAAVFIETGRVWAWPHPPEIEPEGGVRS
jgi:hypothetical protein